MSLRTLLVLLAVCIAGWWFSPLSPRADRPLALPAADGAIACPPPPRVRAGAEPLQSPVPRSMPAVRLADARLEPLHGFSVDARVLSRERYGHDREARYAPLDLALGWGRMREDAVLQRLDISQGGRWFRYRWSDDAPLPPEEIVRSASNMHMIPANAAVAAALGRVRAGDSVRIDGWLVALSADDGWRWRSSTSRTDTGDGACELVLVCSVTSQPGT